MSFKLKPSVHQTFIAVNLNKILTVYKTRPLYVAVGFINEFSRFYLLTENVPVLIEGGEFQELINFTNELSEMVGSQVIKL